MKVGDYVRAITFSKEVKIARIEEIENSFIYLDNKFVVSDIIKSSPNIIDLIEVGDYVNGGKVYEKEKEYIVINADFGRLFEFMNIYEKDIKSIVTKEQFESMEYKVGE